MSLKLVLFFTLMEYSSLLIEMLLIISGDIESNPGPGEYSVNHNFPQYLFHVTLKKHTKPSPYMLLCATMQSTVVPNKAHCKLSRC